MVKIFLLHTSNLIGFDQHDSDQMHFLGHHKSQEFGNLTILVTS